MNSYLKLKFSSFDYFCEYIRFVQPKILITLIDNDPLFYKFKSIFPNIKTIMIQNAFRSNLKTDVLSFKKKLKENNYSVDYYFCFNKAIGNKLIKSKKYLSFFKSLKFIFLFFTKTNIITKTGIKIPICFIKKIKGL